jgi:hypothetical protein
MNFVIYIWGVETVALNTDPVGVRHPAVAKTDLVQQEHATN